MAPLRAALLLCLLAPVLVAAQQQPNPPVWPSTVQVFGPSDSAASIEAAVNAAFATNGGHTPPNHGQFSSSRFAFLFQPGSYAADVPVGFYTHIVGLGESPDDVTFTGQKGVYCEEGDYYFAGGALDTFWRAAEGFRTTSSYNWRTGTGMLWAVSQAAPLRRVHIDNQLSLYEYQPPYGAAGYSSGGFMANCEVGGTVFSGSQQQFMTRNSALNGGWTQANWNMVFAGVQGAPASHCGNVNGHPFTTVAATPIIAEKPFITVTSAGKYMLNVPSTKTQSVGTEWTVPATQVPFEKVYVADNTTDTAASINAQLAAGLHVVLAPGIYTLQQSLKVMLPGQILMGLGFATLVPAAGQPAIVVGNVPGVRIVGPLLLQASTTNTPALLQWGTGSYAGNATDPGIMYDVFARVGGPNTAEVRADVMVSINSDNVIIDNSWLWRADHTVDGIVKDSRNPVAHGLVVEGDNVKAYGLAVEHTLQDLIQWNGENGELIFLQEEAPYDVTQANWGDMGYAGLRIGASVSSFQGYGLGVYSFFRDHNVTMESAIVCPASIVDSLTAPMSVFLSGKGVIEHIVNQEGATTGWNATTHVAYLCQ